MTAAGLGFAAIWEMEVGASCTSGPGTAIGEVVLGSAANFGWGILLVAMLMSAKLTSCVGGAGEGVILADVGLAGGGATIVLTTALL